MATSNYENLSSARSSTIMLRYSFTIILLLSSTSLRADTRSWTMDAIAPAGVDVHGQVTLAGGVEGRSCVFNGTSLFKVRDSTDLASGDGFTLTAWVNPYRLSGSQQMIAAKNQYSLDQRQWGVMIDKDNRFRLYVWQGKWATAESKPVPRPGHWYQIGIVVRPERAELWINGKLADTVELSRVIPHTKAPLTFGGVDDGGRVWQNFNGALDEIRLVDEPLSNKRMALAFRPVTKTHVIPDPLQPFRLWSNGRVPDSRNIPQLEGVRFSVIKPYEFQTDGYRFLHGVALAWHKSKLYASFGHNKGGENTDTEEARYRVSDDGGKTWGDIQSIDAGNPGLGVSHGVFLSHDGQLWAFHGAYSGTMKNVHTRAYTLDESRGRWEHRGTAVGNGFWAMNEPVLMTNGNWIMPRLIVGDGNPAAVAISHGDDLTQWECVRIPRANGVGSMWGESSIIVDGSRIINISRYGSNATALASLSTNFGRTWTPMKPSNLPMVTSKPCAGILSTGQRYLIATTTADTGKRRAPLTIAVSKPGQNEFSKVFIIRLAEFPNGPGESHPQASLAYPYATEHDGMLYIGYSNNGGNFGRTGKGRELWNNNSAEMAVVPVERLRD